MDVLYSCACFYNWEKAWCFSMKWLKSDNVFTRAYLRCCFIWRKNGVRFLRKNWHTIRLVLIINLLQSCVESEVKARTTRQKKTIFLINGYRLEKPFGFGIASLVLLNEMRSVKKTECGSDLYSVVSCRAHRQEAPFNTFADLKGLHQKCLFIYCWDIRKKWLKLMNSSISGQISACFF